MGLLVLRLVLSGFLFFDASGVRAAGFSWPAIDGVIGMVAALLLVACGALVGLGSLTPITQIVVLVVQAAILSSEWWAPTSLMAYGPWQARLCVIAMALALALTGPGAYSLDARLFGRREITFPPRTRGSHS